MIGGRVAGGDVTGKTAADTVVGNGAGPTGATLDVINPGGVIGGVMGAGLARLEEDDNVVAGCGVVIAGNAVVVPGCALMVVAGAAVTLA